MRIILCFLLTAGLSIAQTTTKLMGQGGTVSPCVVNLSTGAITGCTTSGGGGGGTITGPSVTTSGYIPTWGNGVGTLLTTGLQPTATPTANAVVQADGTGHIANGWLNSTTGGQGSVSTGVLTIAAYSLVNPLTGVSANYGPCTFTPAAGTATQNAYIYASLSNADGTTTDGVHIKAATNTFSASGTGCTADSAAAGAAPAGAVLLYTWPMTSGAFQTTAPAAGSGDWRNQATTASFAGGNGITVSGGNTVSINSTVQQFASPTVQTGAGPFTLTDGLLNSLQKYTNVGAIAVGIGQAGSGGNFKAGWKIQLQCLGCGGITLTPTTSTINGSATLTIASPTWCEVVSDGANYSALCSTGATGATGPTGPTYGGCQGVTATSDGSTDVHAALQANLNAMASNGGCVSFPSATVSYYLGTTGLTVASTKQNYRIFSDSGGASSGVGAMIKYNGSGCALTLGDNSAKTYQAVLERIGIDISGAASTATAVCVVQVDNMLLSRVTAETTKGAGAVTGQIGIDVDGGSGSHFTATPMIFQPTVRGDFTKGIYIHGNFGDNRGQIIGGVSGGTTSGPATGGIGIHLASTADTWRGSGTDITGWATGLKVDGGTNGLLDFAYELNTTDISNGGANNMFAGDPTSFAESGTGSTKIFNTGGNQVRLDQTNTYAAGAVNNEAASTTAHRFPNIAGGTVATGSPGQTAYDSTQKSQKWSTDYVTGYHPLVVYDVDGNGGSTDTLCGNVSDTSCTFTNGLVTQFATHYSLPVNGLLTIANKHVRVTAIVNYKTPSPTAGTLSVNLQLNTTNVHASVGGALTNNISVASGYTGTFVWDLVSGGGNTANITCGLNGYAPGWVTSGNMNTLATQPVAVAVNGSIAINIAALWSGTLATGNFFTLKHLTVEVLN